MGKHSRRSWRTQIVLLWVLSAVAYCTYILLPAGEDVAPTDVSATTEASESGKLQILAVTPADVSPGGTLIVRYAGAISGQPVGVMAGAEELPVVARGPSWAAVRVPRSATAGRLGVRLSAGAEPTAAYDVRVKPANWRKPFRSLLGGIALLAVGIALFARGARQVVGLRAAQMLGKAGHRAPVAVGLGVTLGVVMPWTTAAAGLLGGLVESSLTTSAAAAMAFLGAQLGAATAPLLLTSLTDGVGGLVIIAIGTLWMGFAPHRRASALGSLLLGSGLIAYALHLLRPGFEPFLSAPALLPILERLHADSPLGIATCALLGAVLAAGLQGPIPVLVLMIAIAQTTGHLDSNAVLAVLSGSGLGAGIGALLTMPAGAQCRRLARIHLVLGIASTLLAASTLELWTWIADQLVAGAPDQVQLGKRVSLPNFAPHLVVAFALSQVASVVVLVPIASPLIRWIERRWPITAPSATSSPAAAPARARADTLGVLRLYQGTLDSIFELAFVGTRGAGNDAEHDLGQARIALKTMLSSVLPSLRGTGEGRMLGRSTLALLRLHRALEELLRRAEQVADHHMMGVATPGLVQGPLLSNSETETLREMQTRFSDGLAALIAGLEGHEPIDSELAREREIRLNMLEAQARSALLSNAPHPTSTPRDLSALDLVDALESAGNHLYRVTEALVDSFTTIAAAERPDLAAREPNTASI